MEPDARYFRRRANEELAAANRAVTQAARERRMQLAGVFLERLEMVEMTERSTFDWGQRGQPSTAHRPLRLPGGRAVQDSLSADCYWGR